MKKISSRFIVIAASLIMALTVIFTVTGCGSSQSGENNRTAPQIDGLTYESSMSPQYAESFDVYYYSGGYAVIDTFTGGRQYLVVPEGGSIPNGLPDNMTVIKQPAGSVYMAASSVMSLFDSLDALESVSFTSTDADGWYVESAVEALKSGSMVFIGKYSQPDYEGLLEGNCDLAMESTMILHSPETMEKLEELGIPVFIDYSSYEQHPLGRTEWIKVYGVMLGREEAAESFFREQTDSIQYLEDFENTEKTVAYFFINSAGNVVVRKYDDYIPKMIEIAGGRYAFDHLENPDSEAPSVKLSMEKFYDEAVDADYLIYNATIDAPLKSMDDLMEKSGLFKDFKAVKEGNVWTTDKYMYQAADVTAEFINDIHRMVTGGDDEDMVFLKKVE